MTLADPDARLEDELLFRLECEIDGFLADWSHCDLLAEYIGHSVGTQAPDSFYAGNLASAVLNALLETIYWNHGGDGCVCLSYVRREDGFAADARVPVDDRARRFYHRVAEAIRAAEPQALYRTLLVEGRGAPGEAAMVELAAVFGATVLVADAPGGSMVTLWIEVPTTGPRGEK
jgi:hypothetical protein